MVSMNRLFALALITIPIVIGVAAAPYSATIESVWAAPEDSWTSKTPMNQARGRLGVVAVNGKIYAIGGDSGIIVGLIGQDRAAGTGLVVNVTEEYDPTTDTWIFKEPMPTARDYFGIVVYNNKIYCIGGMAHNETVGVNEVYDPATDKWETKTPMPISKGWITAHVIGDKIFVVGGGIYDPTTDSWDVKESITPYDGYVSASVGNKIYIIGGFSEDGQYNLNLIYNTETDHLSEGSYPPSTVGAGGAVATVGSDSMPGNVYVLGANTNIRQGEPGNFVRIYNPANDSWSLGASPELSHVFNFGVTSINDELYVIGGLTYDGFEYKPSDANQVYIPSGVIAGEPLNTPEPTVDHSPQDGLEPLLTPLIISTALIVVIGIGLLVYIKKYKR